MRDYIDAAAFKEMILCADAALHANVQAINELNVFPVPDGDTGTYRNEPYALSADVYSLQNYEGRGGWSMYTGAAGWYFRAAAEIYGENREKND